MDLLKRLKESTVLADGAMGTMLHSRGISFEKCFDIEFDLTNPARLRQFIGNILKQAHKSY